MGSRTDRRPEGSQPIRPAKATASQCSGLCALKLPHDWSLAVAHWDRICRTKKKHMTDCSAQLSMMDVAKQTLVTAAPFSGKSKAIKMLDDSRSLAERQLASAQEEFRQAVKHYKAFKSQKLSQKQLARQDLCMRNAILLVHTEDPAMTLGELREKLMSNAVLALPKELVTKSTASDDKLVTKVAIGSSARRATTAKDNARLLEEKTNKPNKTSQNGKGGIPKLSSNQPVIKHKPARGSLADRKAITVSKVTKTPGPSRLAKKPIDVDIESDEDEPVVQRKAAVKRDAQQAFEQTENGSRKRRSTSPAEKGSTAAKPTVSEAHIDQKKPAVEAKSATESKVAVDKRSAVEKPAAEKKSTDTTKSVDTRSVEASKAAPKTLDNMDPVDVAESKASPKVTTRKTIKLSDYMALKKSKESKIASDVQNSIDATKQKPSSDDDTRTPIPESEDTPPPCSKEEIALETKPVVSSTSKDSDEDATKDTTKESTSKSSSIGSASPPDRPAARRSLGGKGARKPGDAGVARVVKKVKKQVRLGDVEEDASIVDDDDEELKVDIDIHARKALENQGLATDAILTEKRRRSSSSSSSELRKEKRKRAEDDEASGSDVKKMDRKTAEDEKRHDAPS